ncbi:MAG: polysaccharide deacetylase family protein [Clostridiales bacterium]|nr:polysaccharide deacetylase family protein [Clostridiales bacterium]
MKKNNNFKKIAAAAVVLCFTLSACAADSTGETTTEAATDSGQTTNVADTTLEATGVKLGVEEYDSSAVTWGPGNIKEHQRPTDPVNLQNKFSELSAQWLLSDEKNICLTFDEGYENGYTAQILDTLKEKNVKAIFFCTYDYVKDNPELVRRMIDEGHIVGNHSYTHYNMTEVDLQTASDEITMLHDYMAQMFQYDMKYFRFPEGVFSEQTIALAAELGYRSVFWSFAYADWDRDNPPDETEAFKKITSSTHNGEIMLLHAVSKTNADILPDVIDDIKNQGYNFTTEL